MSTVTPAALLDLLGIEYIERPNRLGFCCPFHHDTDPSAGFYLDTGLAHCYSCDYTKDMVAFYAKYREIPYREAERDLERQFGETPKRRPIDRVRIAKERARAERKLAEIRGKTEREIHAYVGEQLDRILLLFERGRLDEQELDSRLKNWYNKTWEEANAGIDPRRTPGARLDDGFTEGMGHLPRFGSQDGEVDLD